MHVVDPAEEKVISALKETKAKGLTRKEIYVKVFSGNRSAAEITALRDKLVRRGAVRVKSVPSAPKGGKPTECWFMV